MRFLCLSDALSTTQRGDGHLGSESRTHFKFSWDRQNLWSKFTYSTKKKRLLLHPHTVFSGLFSPFTRYQLEDESAHLDEMPLMMSEEGFENDESDYHTLPRARATRRRRGLRGLPRLLCGGWASLCTRCVARGAPLPGT